MKKKALLLTASYGSGHLTANKFVQEALHGLYKDKIETVSFDFLKMDTHPGLGNVFKSIYSRSMEYPVLWDIFFKLTDNFIAHWYFRICMPLFYSSIYKYFVREAPDIFIASHPYWSFIIGPYRRKFGKDIPFVLIVTDSTAIHRTWVDGCVDYYVVIDAETRKKLITMGVEEKKIHILGFPVNPGLRIELDRKVFFKRVEMNPDLPMILIVIGLGAKDHFEKLIMSLNEDLAGMNYQVVVLAGKYQDILDRLAKVKFNMPVKLIGWTTEMINFIRASDLVISKGGGAIIGECLSAGKPVLVPVFVPGQEQGNVNYLLKHRLGFYETSLKKISGILKNLLKNPAELKALNERVKNDRKPDSAAAIAKFAGNILKL